MTTAQSPLYPNLFILLVAPPGIGKSVAINPVGEMWKSTQKLIVAPDNMTKASLVDCLGKADRKVLNPGGNPPILEQHSMLCCAPELGVLLPAYDTEFLSLVNQVYDNPASYREERRTLGRSIDISRPQLNLLAGSQPGFMASIMPEEAWTMGFTSRIIMVYAGVTPRVELFDRPTAPASLRPGLVKTMTGWTDFIGEASFTAEAKAELRSWHMADCPPQPEHSKLEHYKPRRIIHVLKLSLISAVSRSNDIIVDLCDVERAKEWLLGAEKVMPDIFRQMVGKSDSQTMQELHFFIYKLYAKDKKPIHESTIFHFLAQHVPSDRITKIVEIAERSNIIVRSAGTNAWVPRPKNEHGME